MSGFLSIRTVGNKVQWKWRTLENDDDVCEAPENENELLRI